MFKQHRTFSLIFFLIMILNLMIQATFFEGYSILIKPLICLSLAFYLYMESNMKAGFNRLVFAGLIFSLMGDILLLYAGSDVFLFLYGLVSFLMAHILYSSAFFVISRTILRSQNITGI